MARKTHEPGGAIFIHSCTLDRTRVPNLNVYPFSLPAIKALDTLSFRTAVTFFVGENGSGKSTLVEAIAVAAGFNPEGGTKNFHFRTKDSHSVLEEYLMIGRPWYRERDGFFLRAESFYNVASEIDNLGVSGSYGGLSLHEQSHGEAFLSLAKHRFGGQGLYILDEPEAALSPQGLFTLLTIIHDLSANSQFIIATHSPILMALPGATIYLISEEGIDKVEYEDTEHYKLTSTFMKNPKGFLERLLRE